MCTNQSKNLHTFLSPIKSKFSYISFRDSPRQSHFLPSCFIGAKIPVALLRSSSAPFSQLGSLSSSPVQSRLKFLATNSFSTDFAPLLEVCFLLPSKSWLSVYSAKKLKALKLKRIESRRLPVDSKVVRWKSSSHLSDDQLLCSRRCLPKLSFLCAPRFLILLWTCFIFFII